MYYYYITLHVTRYIVLHPPASKRAQTHANSNHSSILTKIDRNFYPVRDISTFKRSFHSILHAKRSARVFQRRNKPRNSQVAISRRFWRKLCVISFPFLIFRRLKAIFTALCMQNVAHAFSSFQTSPDTRKSQFAGFDES